VTFVRRGSLTAKGQEIWWKLNLSKNLPLPTYDSLDASISGFASNE